jgi:hypothetical protein
MGDRMNARLPHLSKTAWVIVILVLLVLLWTILQVAGHSS